MKPFWLEHPGIVLTFLIVPLLYATGYMYDLGYLSQYGLEPTLLEHSINYYFMNSFYVSWLVVIYLLQHINSLGEILLLLCFMVSLLTYVLLRFPKIITPKDLDLDSIFTRIKNIQNHHLRYLILSVGSGATYALTVIFASLCLFFIICLPMAAYKTGIDFAKNEITDYKPCSKNELKTKGCVYISEGTTLIASGRSIATTEQFMAIFDGAQTKIVPIDNLNQITIVVK